MAARPDSPLRIGISRCLLGEPVRYDGGHKRDDFLTEILGGYVVWVPVCPEVEAGLGTPREAMRLVGTPDGSQLVTIHTGQDRTATMTQFSMRRVKELEDEELDGFVLKSKSPSCGLKRVCVYRENGRLSHRGVGLFAGAFMRHFPLIPVEDEERLKSPAIRENFIERLFCYRRWRDLVTGGVSRRTIRRFHEIHKYLLLAHSPPHYRKLEQLVANARSVLPKELAAAYGLCVMDALTVKATVRKHVNVLACLIGHLMSRLADRQRVELQQTIKDFHCGLLPLIIPVTLMKYYARLLDITALKNQVYLNPDPKELMLRNRV